MEFLRKMCICIRLLSLLIYMSSASVSPCQGPLWSQTCFSCMTCTSWICSSCTWFVPSDSNTSYMWVYVDDIILVNSIVPAAHRLVSAPCADFAVKDLGKLHFFLGLEVTHTLVVLTLIRQKCSLDLLWRACMLQCMHLLCS
jgi:hypothetical protein